LSHVGTKARRQRLKSKGIRDGIMRKDNRWHKLGRWAVRRNRIISHRRARSNRSWLY
jgi:transposase, IS5 family